MTGSKSSMHDPHTHANVEHVQWMHKLEKWRAEHKRAMAQLARMQAALMAHDAEISEYLIKIRRHDGFIGEHRRLSGAQANGTAEHLPDAQIYGEEDDHQRGHRLMRINMKYTESTHRRTVEIINQAYEQLQQVRSDFRDEQNQPPIGPTFDGRDHVEQAGFESFPASDPPSFNPGTV